MLQLENTMTRKRESFEPRNDRLVKMFTCGPSIYRRPHVGNYRTFIWEDVLQRYLEYLGYSVQRVLNFTDVEDKSIEEAEKEGKSVKEVTGAVAGHFMKEAKLLGIKLPDNIPRSSTSVEQAVHLIQKLIEKGYAYWHDGDVFFDPLKFSGFGKLFRLDMSRWPKKKVRFKKDTYPGQRWNLGDFVLWHGYREGDGVYWDTEIGKGRPAWNIQDPAMISASLGYSLDIFCGGIDNMCRHHDYNIAVMESVSGEELARYWLHGQHVLVNGKKMSKSLDNEVYPEDLVARGFSWNHVRFYLLHKPYRKRINLTQKSFQEISDKLDAFRSMANDIVQKTEGSESTRDETVGKLIQDLSSRFEDGMNDDLNTLAAFEGIFEIVSKLHDLKKAGRLGRNGAVAVEKELRKIDRVLQVIWND
jgi:cysteinyl-tRNA synthetase